MKVIGLTGGIGSGKSTVSQFLNELGAVVIDADKVGHEAFKQGTPAYKDILAAFGEQVLKSDKEIDRAKLGKIVFNDERARAQLNHIMHERIWEMIAAQLEKLRQQGIYIAVVEAALLVEAGWVPRVDKVWVTVADEETILKRLTNRSGYSNEESLARIRAQLADDGRAVHADVIINTNCTLEELKAKVKELWRGLVSECA